MLALNDNQLLKTSSFVNGEWLNAQSHFSVTNPANGETITHVGQASIGETELAIAQAKAAFSTWRNTPANERSAILRKWYNLIIEHSADLAQILTLEQGKPINEALGEIHYGASFIEWFAEEAKRVYGDTIPSLSGTQRLMVIKQPVGVVSAITPWNFPHAMIARKAAAALATGCTFIVRPASQTPLSALAMAELANRAGIPKGVFNIVVSEDAQGIGNILTTHPDIAKFTFTGSTDVGKTLISQCASTVKKVSMELGGNAPFIVFNDADIDEAVTGAIASKYRNAGQTCVCTNRILVQNQVLTEFTEKYTRAVSQLVVGNGMDENTDIGPMISHQAALQVKAMVDEAILQGATCVSGGTIHKKGLPFMSPTILTNVKSSMAITQQEIFGPISPIMSFEQEEEAIKLANDTPYGLAAYFYSRDIGRTWRVAESLNFGMIGVNEGIISNAAAPFGGMKQSGNGREGSKYGLDDYLDIKYLCLGGINK